MDNSTYSVELAHVRSEEEGVAVVKRLNALLTQAEQRGMLNGRILIGWLPDSMTVECVADGGYWSTREEFLEDVITFMALT